MPSGPPPGSTPMRAAPNTISTANSAPPRVPATTLVQSRIIPILSLLLRPNDADNVIGALPVGTALLQSPPGAQSEHSGLAHRAGIVIGLGGRQIRHRLVLQQTVSLGGFIPGKDVVVFPERCGLQILQGR